MIVSKAMERAPWTRGGLIGWTKAIASRFAGGSEPCPDIKEFGPIASDQNPSIPRNETFDTGRQESAPIVPLCC